MEGVVKFGKVWSIRSASGGEFGKYNQNFDFWKQARTFEWNVLDAWVLALRNVVMCECG